MSKEASMALHLLEARKKQKQKNKAKQKTIVWSNDNSICHTYSPGDRDKSVGPCHCFAGFQEHPVLFRC